MSRYLNIRYWCWRQVQQYLFFSSDGFYKRWLDQKYRAVTKPGNLLLCDVTVCNATGLKNSDLFCCEGEDRFIHFILSNKNKHLSSLMSIVFCTEPAWYKRVFFAPVNNKQFFGQHDGRQPARIHGHLSFWPPTSNKANNLLATENLQDDHLGDSRSRTAGGRQSPPVSAVLSDIFVVARRFFEARLFFVKQRQRAFSQKAADLGLFLVVLITSLNMDRIFWIVVWAKLGR